MSKFEESSIYQVGMLYTELGKLLTFPDTSLNDIADFCDAHGFSVDFLFKTKAKEPGDQAEPVQAASQNKD